jgi:superfamily II DNA/RNA helicase
VQTLADALDATPSLQQVLLPDLWQQQAVSALRAGQDVVVHAPTGAGKTLIFELWSNQGRPRGQAIYTVPTRALANDKLAEWRARGWNVGIATGDLAENLHAPILVATLETQKHRLLQGDGPRLLVVDEYQMIGDPDRGLNYELAIALAPAHTQLLLLSGSVGNPQDVVKWLRRLGRDAVLVRDDDRPVPLEEVYAPQLSYHVPSEIRGYWPRLVAKALAENLGPLLIFAPRRLAAEELADDLGRQLPNPHPLTLSPAQKTLVGERLARLLKARVAYHHSGLSYGARAGVVEPLAKAGQLRVVVATMGLAAGINFSLRSVALAGDSYRRDQAEQPLRADEILQMFGRAGRRGIDEIGYALVTANELRLLDAHPRHLARNGMVDWGALLGLMTAAADQERDPFTEAVQIQERLFTSKPILLGVEESLKHPDTPCGLKTDAERARHVRQRLREMANSRGEWERFPATQSRPLREVWLPDAQGGDRLRPALSEPAALDKVGLGQLCVLEERDGLPIHGRTFTVADRIAGDRVLLVKWVRRMINWHGRHTTLEQWRERIRPLVEQGLAQRHTPVVQVLETPEKLSVQVSLADLTVRVPVDSLGKALWRPREREVFPTDCARCELVEICRALPTGTGTAMLWRRLGLVDAHGVPTRRGRVVSFFAQGDGLAIAAGLEEETYPLDEMVYDLANLEAGFRFAGDDNRWAGRLALACHRAYGLQSIPGYLENGLPPKYGAGAELVVATAHQRPELRHTLVSEIVGPGDLDRVLIEWRSLLRRVARAPALEWPRWTELQERARDRLQETESPTLIDLPPLEYLQQRRVDHQLLLRRH